MSAIDKAVLERRVTIGIALLAATFALPLFALSVALGVAALSQPQEPSGLLVASFPFTFAVFLGAISWRGFASAKVIGAALSPHGWRILAAVFGLIGIAAGSVHWFGVVLPFVVGAICLLGDPKFIALLRRAGLA